MTKRIFNLEELAAKHDIPYAQAFELYKFESKKLLDRDWPKLGSFLHVPQLTYSIIDKYYQMYNSKMDRQI